MVVGDEAKYLTIVATDSVSSALGERDGFSYCGFTYEFVCDVCRGEVTVEDGNQGTVSYIKNNDITSQVKFTEVRTVKVTATKGTISLDPVIADITIQVGYSCEEATLTTPSQSYFEGGTIELGPTGAIL